MNRGFASIPLAIVLASIASLAHAAPAVGDPTSRALLERQQQSDAFALQLQQSIENFRPPRGILSRTEEKAGA